MATFSEAEGFGCVVSLGNQPGRGLAVRSGRKSTWERFRRVFRAWQVPDNQPRRGPIPEPAVTSGATNRARASNGDNYANGD